MSKTNAKEQAGKNLPAAVDDYTYAVLTEPKEERTLAMNRRLRKYSEEFSNMLSRPPESRPGPYEQYPKENING